MRTTLIIAPDQATADALRWAYRKRRDVTVTAYRSITGHRGDRVVVLPMPPAESKSDLDAINNIRREQVLTKVGPGVELIEL